MPSLPWNPAVAVMYQKVPVNQVVDPNSAAMIARFNSAAVNSLGIADQIARGVGPAFTATARTPIWFVDNTVPAVPVPLDTGPWGDEIAAMLAEGVPIPSIATEPTSNDKTLCVYRTTDKTLWELTAAQKALHFPQPLGVGTTLAGGTLNGTYSYNVTSLNANGETTAKKTFITRTVGPGSRIQIQWSVIDGATGYRIYRGPTAATATLLTTVSGTTQSFIDDGSLTPDGVTLVPTVNTATTPEWRANYGGRMRNIDQSPGHYRNLFDSAGNKVEGYDWGPAATRIAVPHAIITRDELQTGVIPHAISIGAPNISSIIREGVWAYPAQDSDGHYTKTDGVVEGARMFLPASFNVDSIAYRWPITRMLVVAAKEYGMFAHDGSTVTVVYAESPEVYTAIGQPDYIAELVGPTSAARKEALVDFPWASLQVATMTLCTNPLLPCTLTGQGADRPFTPRGMASDAFDDLAGTSVEAHLSPTTGWGHHPSNSGGSMQIVDFRAKGPTGGGRVTNFTTFVPPTADYAIEADLKVFDLVGGGSGFAFELWLRLDPTVDTGYTFGYTTGDQSWKIRKVVGGVVTVVATAPATPAVGDHLVRFEVFGGTLNAYVDGNLVLTYVDPTPIVAVGRPGIGSRIPISNTGGMHLDAVYIMDVGAPPHMLAPLGGTVVESVQSIVGNYTSDGTLV